MSSSKSSMNKLATMAGAERGEDRNTHCCAFTLALKTAIELVEICSRAVVESETSKPESRFPSPSHLVLESESESESKKPSPKRKFITMNSSFTLELISLILV